MIVKWRLDSGHTHYKGDGRVNLLDTVLVEMIYHFYVDCLNK